jgi:uncharacterized protein YbaP (TraB family)
MKTSIAVLALLLVTATAAARAAPPPTSKQAQAAASPAERPSCPPALPTQPDATAAAAKDRGLLWRATRDGRSLYLFGTLHVGKPNWRKLGPLTSAALRASDVLALEVDPNDPALLQALADTRPPQPLPDALQQRLLRAFERACMASEALATLHPVLQATTLTVMEARWLGMDASYAMEQVLSAQVRTLGRRVVALESAAAQIQALVPTDEGEARQLLDQSLQQLEDRSARRVLAKLSQAWELGDEATLEDYEKWCECAADEADRAFLKKLNDDRNGPLADGIEGHHKQGRRVFAAVGALHMTGPQSLPRLLAQRGFKVERVPFKR